MLIIAFSTKIATAGTRIAKRGGVIAIGYIGTPLDITVWQQAQLFSIRQLLSPGGLRT